MIPRLPTAVLRVLQTWLARRTGFIGLRVAVANEMWDRTERELEWSASARWVGR